MYGLCLLNKLQPFKVSQHFQNIKSMLFFLNESCHQYLLDFKYMDVWISTESEYCLNMSRMICLLLNKLQLFKCRQHFHTIDVLLYSQSYVL